MEYGESLEKLLEAFNSTFVGELIPGIVHNFANPLNGIMGRAQIMERRLKDMITQLEKEHPAVAARYAPLHDKLRRDIASINQESDRFFSMFRDVSDKFNTLQCETIERIDLSRLLSREIRFAEHYLDFKHGVAKEIKPMEGLPEIQGSPKIYSLALWGLLRYVHKRMGKGKANRLTIEAREVKGYIRLDISYEASDGILKSDAETEQILKGVSTILAPLGAKVEAEAASSSGILSVFFAISS